MNLEVIWPFKGLRPSARNLAYFGKENAKAFKLASKHFVGLLKGWERIDGETSTIDSTKIRAHSRGDFPLYGLLPSDPGTTEKSTLVAT